MINNLLLLTLLIWFESLSSLSIIIQLNNFAIFTMMCLDFKCSAEEVVVQTFRKWKQKNGSITLLGHLGHEWTFIHIPPPPSYDSCIIIIFISMMLLLLIFLTSHTWRRRIMPYFALTRLDPNFLTCFEILLKWICTKLHHRIEKVQYGPLDVKKGKKCIIYYWCKLPLKILNYSNVNCKKIFLGSINIAFHNKSNNDHV